MTHPSPKRNMVPKEVLMRSGLVSFTTARPINAAQPKTTVNSARPMTNAFNKAHSTVRRPLNNKITTKNRNLNQKVNTARPNAILNAIKGNQVNTARPKAVLNAIKGNRVNTARPKAVLNAVKGNQVNAVKASTCWIQVSDGLGHQKRLIFLPRVHGNPQQDLQEKGDMLPLEVTPKEGKSQVEVQSKQLTDESHVLLKVPRKNNMYSVDLKNIVPKGGITCLFAKATSDESKLWHRRLGHINFKTMNKLVKGNLVRGLPSKLFENDQTCVSCQKGKQHKASCKSKIVSSISQPLHMLHMDLFGPTFVKSLMKKMYCLVVTDDYSRFSWVFFLATKDETSGILKSFITGVENLIDQRVKVIRCNNGTKFKNNEMNQFCERKGIKREFSIAKTRQQNGVAERKNRTLIEADRTMLADSKLPTTFWAEAVNTACYVQNRVVVIKPHNKTPYELFLGRKPALGFMRPFGCPVTILNTSDHLGKFDGKVDEGFFIGYSINRSGPNWLFDIDALTKSMNYKPVVAGNQSNGNAGTKVCDDTGKARMETVPGKDYILLPLWIADPPFSQSSKSSPDVRFKPSGDVKKKADNDQEKEENDQEKDANVNNTNKVNTVSPTDNTANTSRVNTVGENMNKELPVDPNMHALEDISIFDFSNDDEDDGAVANMNNLDTTIQVSHIPTTRIHKDHPLEQVIRYLHSTIHEYVAASSLLFQEFLMTKKCFQNRIWLKKRLMWLKKEVSIADPVTTTGEVVTTASVEVSTVSPIEVRIGDELTLAQTLIAIRSAKPKVKGVVIEERSESTIRTRPQQLLSKV
ncbi:putative ribonuclease H-like domain-containing protein [Tanacetum coccineum]|uniref:Ribonuclease H-like domain-containing protein n=1 Tax=Tanacetum coccineum TaxID=301880 RepID=A0ABQ5B6F5_9ASTR